MSTPELAKKIRDNFLLVEYAPGDHTTEITEHDIDIESMAAIRINKIKTDNYTAIYDALSKLVTSSFRDGHQESAKKLEYY